MESSHLAESTKHRNEEIIAWFADPLDKLPLTSITDEVITEARKTLLVGRKPATANRYLAVLSAILNNAKARGKVKQVPAIPLFDLPETDPPFITREQFAALLNALPLHTRRAALFSVITGLRMANVRDLVWGRVSLERAHMWIPRRSAKGKKPIGLPIPEEALELLRSIPREAGVDHVFTYRGRAIRSTFNTKAYRKALRKVGLVGVNWHTLRHTWASWLAQDGASPIILKELGAWASTRMPERYSHLNADHLKEWAARSKTKVAAGGS